MGVWVAGYKAVNSGHIIKHIRHVPRRQLWSRLFQVSHGMSAPLRNGVHPGQYEVNGPSSTLGGMGGIDAEQE
jgi:hypothetical protein